MRHVGAGLALARRALAGLRRRGELAALSRVVARRGIPAWIVGGAVRDRCLGLEVTEIDVAVSRDAEGVARELEAEGLGRAVFLSRDRPGPRVFRVAGRRLLDIAEIEGGSIAADLARRDFTINALAIALDTGEIVDPFGGLYDLARQKLRVVSARNMIEDPLRALRAARFLATHGLVPDQSTLSAARRAAPLLRRAAPERIGVELAKLLGSPAAAPALRWAARAGLLACALGLDLSDSLAARIARDLSALDDRATRTLPPDRRRRLRLARVAQRMGLPAAQTRRWLRARRWGRREADEVARLVELVASAGKLRTRRDVWAWILAAGPLAGDALRLLARLGPAARRRASRLRPLARFPVRSVGVTGDDIVSWLGLRPGPAVGEWLARLRVAAAMGDVKSRRQARNWLSVQVEAGP